MSFIIYSEKITPRLRYVLDFVFSEEFNTAYTLTSTVEDFQVSSSIKINYSDKLLDADVKIIPSSLLFEINIQPFEISISEDQKFFCNNSDPGFDIFSAIFFLISRYEEYLPHEKDFYGRFAHNNSLAFKNNFLQLPLVNIWLKDFGKQIHAQGRVKLTSKKFSFIPTYDIDIAYSILDKGLLRTVAGFVRQPSLNTIKVLRKQQKDPFDCYDNLDLLHTKYRLDPKYFFLLAEERSRYDRNNNVRLKSMRQLLIRHKKYSIGIHPSYQSYTNPNLIRKEKEFLECVTGKQINISRQHYIKMDLPATYRNLLASGITDDYSMGYGSINGFRASCASSFYWYDLEKETTTSLRIHPFCFMDANSFYEQKQSAAESFDELKKYYEVTKNAGSQLISIFHNNFLGTDKQFNGWIEMYQQFLELISTDIN